MAILKVGSVFNDGELIESSEDATQKFNQTLSEAKTYIEGLGGGVGSYTEGTNNNGSWIRFDNGIQMCWNVEDTGSHPVGGGWGGVLYIRNSRKADLKGFPVDFIQTPAIVKQTMSLLGGDTIIDIATGAAPDRYHPGDFSGGRATYRVIPNYATLYLAIGRWK